MEILNKYYSWQYFSKLPYHYLETIASYEVSKHRHV